MKTSGCKKRTSAVEEHGLYIADTDCILLTRSEGNMQKHIPGDAGLIKQETMNILLRLQVGNCVRKVLEFLQVWAVLTRLAALLHAQH
jgi:hypothetical protein